MYLHLSLKYRIALIVFVLEAIMLSLVLWQTLAHSYTESSKLIQSNQEAVLELVSGISRTALITEEYAELQPYIENLLEKTEASQLYLADADAIIIASSIASDLGQRLPILADGTDSVWRVNQLTNISGTQGTLAIKFSSRELMQAHITARDFGVIFALAGMLIIAAVGIMVGYFLTRQLDVITQTAHRLSEGDLSARTHLQGNDELGELAVTFDRMVQNLQDKEQSLNQTLRSLEEREQDLAITLNSIGDAVIVTDDEGVIKRMNPIAEKLTGWSLAQAKSESLDTVFPIIDVSTRKQIENPIKKVMGTGEVVYLSNHTTLVDKNGKEYQIADSAAPILDSDGNIHGMVLVFNDVTEKYLLREKARDIQQQLQGLFNNMQTMVAILETDGTIVFVNKAPLDKLSIEPGDLIGQKVWDTYGFRHETRIQDVLQGLLKRAKKGNSVSQDMQLLTSDGLIWIDLTLHPIVNDNGVVTQILAEGRDINERKIAEEKILYQAHYDELTKLPNRFLSLDRLTQAVSEAMRCNESVAVIFIDLDDFKKVNDTMGHETGDKLLIQAAERLTNSLRSGDTIGRLGGDEFIVVLRGIHESAEAQPIAEYLLRQFRNSFLINDREITLTLSIGIAVYPDDGDNASDLLRNSDAAMYHAKEQGRNTYSFFTTEMNAGVVRRLALEEQMHGSIERGEFKVYFQPQVEISSGHVMGAEALLRWHNPALGTVLPLEFINVAEQTGFILPLGRFVITEALSQAAQWIADIHADFQISINLSPRQFRDIELVEFISSSLEQFGVQGNNLEMEITEGVLMSGHSSVDSILSSLNQLGIGISMDDFGTGYSSLSYLRRYPFNMLKIDKSFVDGIDVDSADRKLIAAAIAMAHGLGLKVIAEGVETADQLSHLRDLGCEYAQGHLFSKALPAAEISKFLSDSKTFKSLS